MAPLPRPLLRKRQQLAFELVTLEAQANEARERLRMVDGAIRLLDPKWKAPKPPKKRLPVHHGRLPVGEAARQSLRALKHADGPLTTSDIVERLARQNALQFTDRQDRDDFASSVAMALRRYKSKGLVTGTRFDESNRLRWELATG